MNRLSRTMIVLMMALAPTMAIAKGHGGGGHPSGGGHSHSSHSSRSGRASSRTAGHSTACYVCAHRSRKAREEFMRMTGYPHGRPGYVIDHVTPLKRGGADDPSNMAWQTVADAKAKDRWE